MRVWAVWREQAVRVLVVWRGQAVKERGVGVWAVSGLGGSSLWRVALEGN